MRLSSKWGKIKCSMKNKYIVKMKVGRYYISLGDL